MRKTIVFKNYGFFNLIKHPVKTTCHSFSAAKIEIGVIMLDFTGPINLLDNAPNLCTTTRFA